MVDTYAIRCEAVKTVFRTAGESFVALDGVSLKIAPGEFVALVGPSGCGKTTLLHSLSGIIRPDGGRVWVDGTELTALGDGARTRLRRDRIGIVFQKFNLMPTLSALDNVGIMRKLGAKAGRKTPEEMLEAVGLGNKVTSLPSELSMGEEQRVAVARALYTEPTIILADEPTGSVDSASKAHILDIFERCNREMGRAILIATHDPAVAGRAGRVIEMADGRVI
jgi:putative ABC transport system ATP-binding protein